MLYTELKGGAGMVFKNAKCASRSANATCLLSMILCLWRIAPQGLSYMGRECTSGGTLIISNMASITYLKKS
jgi:hypothetical protein